MLVPKILTVPRWAPLFVATVMLVLTALAYGAERAAAGSSEYEVEVAATEASGTISANALIQILTGGNYNSAQWSIDYNEAVVSFVSATPTAGLAAQCDSETQNDDGNRILLGCIAFSGDPLSFEGVAWNLVFSCETSGTADFNFIDIGSDTFVSTSTGGIRPTNTINDSVTCGGAAPPTATATVSPTPGAAISPTAARATATPTNTPGTPGPGETPPPGATTAPGGSTPPSGAQTPGGGTGPGGVQPPDTGTGASNDTADGLWVAVAVTALGAVAIVGGAYSWRRGRVRG
jgi:hypothetical protein